MEEDGSLDPEVTEAGPSNEVEFQEATFDREIGTEISETGSSLSSKVDVAVEEAADSVCIKGIAVVVENDDSFDAEERRVARFLQEGCCCKLHAGNPCSSLFTAADVLATRDECRQLTQEQRDMVLMGQFHALCQRDQHTQKVKAKNTECQHTTTLFCYGGHRVCQKVFVFLHAMSEIVLKAIKQSWMAGGLCPRVHAKVLPHNTTKLLDFNGVVRFILQYAEYHAILLPGRIPGYKRDDLQLPSSTTKRQVWEAYHQAATLSGSMKAISYSLFCKLWKILTPLVVVKRPMSDFCCVCQKKQQPYHTGPQQTCGGEIRGKYILHLCIQYCNTKVSRRSFCKFNLMVYTTFCKILTGTQKGRDPTCDQRALSLST